MSRHLLLLFALFWINAAGAAERDLSKRSSSAENEASARRKLILAEIKRLAGQGWGGVYYAGDGLGVNTSIAIAPRSGYVFEWHGCMGLYDRNYGAVTRTNGRIRLNFTFENQRKGFQGIAPEFVPVAWGARRYLIPADELINFCNSVNQGAEPRRGSYGLHLLRQGDESKPVHGFPRVPKGYASCLLSKPLEANIIAVGASTTRPSVIDKMFKDTSVTLDVGSQRGVRVGMEFLVIAPKDLVKSVQVTKVDRFRSEAVMTEFGEAAPPPEVGWRLSTRAP